MTERNQGDSRPAPPPPMTDEEIEAQAEADEDDPPWTDEEWAQAQMIPRVRILRETLRLSQEVFAERYMIPMSVLQSWEEGLSEPDAAGRAYIRAIMGDAEGVARALHSEPRRAAE